ncbi:hypothetical protein, partial [Pantoea brenneri]|uniref:hypothetical protein n=1 Tax=Pantoea brenneri TaxID=472694 RepID=UPI00289E86C9
RRLAAPCRSPAAAKLKLPQPAGERNLLIAPFAQRAPLENPSSVVSKTICMTDVVWRWMNASFSED